MSEQQQSPREEIGSERSADPISSDPSSSSSDFSPRVPGESSGKVHGATEEAKVPRARRYRRTRRLSKPEEIRREPLTAEQRLLLLDTWNRSGLAAKDFGTLCGVSAQTLYAWRRRFEKQGPEGLMDRPRGVARGSKLSDLTRRTILMLKESNPDWGCQRISDMLARGPALPASASAVAKVLHEAGYELVDSPSKPHGQEPRRFERAKPNQLWQTDLFTFVLKRQNRRVYLVAFLDDHSRFLVAHALAGTQSKELVLEALRRGIASYRQPEEILTDNGSQYVTWRGKSAFAKECEKRGIEQLVATPRRPQTLGKIERFWGTLWKECVETAIFLDLDDARKRIACFVDHYNFQRPHQGINGLVPADRYFGAAPEVLKALRDRVKANSLEIARQGEPKAPFYLTGNAGGKPFSVHAEGERVILQREEGEREEIDLVKPDPEPGKRLPQPAPDDPHEPVPAPGTSPIDAPFGLFDSELDDTLAEEPEVES